MPFGTDNINHLIENPEVHGIVALSELWGIIQ